MGVTSTTWDFLKKYMSLENTPNICELGDQQFMGCYGFNELSWVGDALKAQGYRYVSIDWNGFGGAIKYDLCEEIEDETLKGSFDIVTNFGTSEHVQNLYNCFRNIDYLCKVGGLMIHMVPKTGGWPNHCTHWVDEEFFEMVAGLCDYEIVEMFTENATLQMCCVLRKTREGFCGETDFNKIPVYDS